MPWLVGKTGWAKWYCGGEERKQDGDHSVVHDGTQRIGTLRRPNGLSTVSYHID
jgi:hypothetical protein